MSKFQTTPAIVKAPVSIHGMTLKAIPGVTLTHVNHALSQSIDVSAFAAFDCRQIAPGQFYVVGADDLPKLDNVTLTDQSHGTVLLELTGDHYRDILASLTGTDLSDARTNRSAIQTQLGHVSVNIKLLENGVSMIVPRSFVQAVWSDLEEAMRIFG